MDMDITVVSTAEELQAAVIDGQPHIEIREHLDLTTLPDVPYDFDLPEWNPSHLGVLPESIKSIRGNCDSGPPSEEDLEIGAQFPRLRPLSPGQCLLLTDADVAYVVFAPVWLDSVFLRVRRSSRDSAPGRIINYPKLNSTALLWMTNVTMQGDDGRSRALEIYKAAHMEDCLFANLGQAITPFTIATDTLSEDLLADPSLIYNTTASFRRCRFVDNTITNPRRGLVQSVHGTFARFEACEFSDNSLSYLFRTQDRQGRWFSDDESQRVVALDWGPENRSLADPVQPLEAAPEEYPFLSLESEWFVSTANEANQLRAVLDASSSDDSSSFTTAAIVALVIGGVGLLALVGLVGYLCYRRAWRAEDHAKGADGSSSLTADSQAAPIDLRRSHNGDSALKHPLGAATTASLAFTEGTGAHTPPPPGASLRDHVEFLKHQLDISGGMTVLNGLTLRHGDHNRIQGGQAVIQFAEDRSSREYAAKFFVSKAAFADEVALFTDKNNPLGQFLPRLRNIEKNSDNRLVDALGRPLPPCIVMEKGESLDRWSQRNSETGLDMATGLQVILHIAESLKSLHAAGYVHRDLKHSNIMWLPRENRWTLIDFGCAAKAEEEAHLAFSLSYAPPEVIQAVRGGQKAIIAQKSMDMWSLGVVAVELFSNQHVLSVLEGRDVVMQRILGELPLPWEPEDPDSQQLLKSLGRMAPLVLMLLDRDLTCRPTIEQFRASCNNLLSQTTTA